MINKANKADNNTLHRSSFLHIFSICYLAWIPVILITVFLNTTLEDFIGITLSGVALMGILAFIWVLAYPVAISGDGIKIRNSSGKSCLISWREIVRVKPVKFLHLNYIKLFGVNYIKPLWMPFTFTSQNQQKFLEDIRRYAPEGHPLKVFIETGEMIEVKRPVSSASTESTGNAGNTENMIDTTDYANIQIKNALKNGANWFYWIAGLSLINTIVFIFGGNFSFVVGLSITQLIDAFASGISQVVSSDIAGIISVFSVAGDVVIAGVFIIFGYFANKRHNWSFITGMIVYALDTVIALVFEDYLSAGFHVLAIYGIFNGLRANKRLAGIERSVATNYVAGKDV